MTERLRDWLPAEAAEHHSVRQRVDGCVAEWSAHWFVGRVFALSTWQANSRSSADGKGGPRAAGVPITVQYSQRAAERLAAAALDVSLQSVELTYHDRAIISAVGRQILDDLSARLRRLLSIEMNIEQISLDEKSILGTISDDSDELLSINVPARFLVSLCREILPISPPSLKSLNDRREAISEAVLALRATLGVAVVKLEDARNLAVGDLLVLDRSLSDAAELSLMDSDVLVARGLLTEVDGQAALFLQPIAATSL